MKKLSIFRQLTDNGWKPITNEFEEIKELSIDVFDEKEIRRGQIDISQENNGTINIHIVGSVKINLVNQCPCGSGKSSQMEFDARGIEIGFMCEDCEKEKLAGYRKEILTNPNYECDENIEPENDLDYMERYFSENLFE